MQFHNTLLFALIGWISLAKCWHTHAELLCVHSLMLIVKWRS